MRLPELPNATRTARRPPLAELPQFPKWPPLLATRGPGSMSSLHAHHAMHFVGCISGDLSVQLSRGGPWRRAAGLVTQPDAVHAIDARGAVVLLVFLDPESDAGRALGAALPDPVRLLPAEIASPLAAADPMSLMGTGGEVWLALAVEMLGGPSVRHKRLIHPRVRKLLDHLASHPEIDVDASLEGLAQEVGLSPGRLMHVFTESIGIPLRPYVLWLKLQRAAAAIASGTPLAQAAHVAGFADAAHMSRTFRRMLGATPSSLQRP